MRSLFFKELRQGRSVVLFGLALGLLMPALYLASVRISRPLSPVEVDDLRGKLAFSLLFLPPLIALFAGAGLFAAEAGRGTLPALFSLPVSRLRIWLAKILGGLALGALGSALLLVTANLILPNPAGQPQLVASAYLPDMCLWALFIFAAAAFASTLTSHSTAATLLAFLLSAGLAGAIVVVAQLGARLLGYDVVFDLAIWAGITALPLLFASALAVSRGELFQSPRRHLLASSAFIIALALISAVSIGLARAATRYQRADVEQIHILRGHDASPFSSTIPIIAYADPTPYRRIPEKGWLHTITNSAARVSYKQRPAYRSTYAVLVDPSTGLELDLLRLAGDAPNCIAAISGDGRYAALAYYPAGLGWAGNWFSRQPQALRILDVAARSVLREEPRPNLTRNQWSYILELAFAAHGDHLAYPLQMLVGERYSAIHTISADGTQVHTLPTDADDWAWSPTEEALFVLDREMTVRRFPPDGTEGRIIWAPGPDDPYTRRTLPVSGVSPDGRWLVLTEEQTGAVETRTGSAVELRHAGLRAISTDGRHSRPIWSADHPRSTAPRLAWSSDASSLYFVVCPDHPSRGAILRWRPGDPNPETIIADLPFNSIRLLPIPGSGRILVWGQLLGHWPNISEVYEAEAFILDAAGRTQPLPTPDPGPAFARNHFPHGFDGEGRLIYQPADQTTLNTLDISTGQARQIYP